MMRINQYRNQIANNYGKIEDIAVFIQPILKVFRFTGSCPIYIEGPPRDQLSNIKHCKYSFKLFSLSTLYSSVILSGYFILSLITIGEIILTDKFSRLSFSKSPIADWVVLSFALIFHLWLWLSPFLSAIRTSYLATLLNHISDFRNQFKLHFNGRDPDFSYAKLKIRKLCIISIFSFIFLLSGELFIYYPCMSNIYSTRKKGFETCQNFTSWELWVAFAGALSVVFVALLQDVVLLSLFAIIENMIIEMKIALELYTNRYVEPELFSHMTKLGRFMKIEIDLLNDIIGPGELATYFLNFVTFIIYSIMLVYWSDYDDFVRISIGSFCSYNLIRVLVKTKSVNGIRAVEKRIQKLILTVNTKTYSESAECERCVLWNAMIGRPIRFILCGILPLENSLTIKLIGGVVTYLLVVIQFQNLLTKDEDS